MICYYVLNYENYNTFKIGIHEKITLIMKFLFGIKSDRFIHAEFVDIIKDIIRETIFFLHHWFGI